MKDEAKTEAVDNALIAAKVVADNAQGVPLIGSAIGLISILCEVAQTVRANRQQVNRLAERVKAVTPILERVQKTECKQQFLVALEEFKGCIEACIRQAKQYTHKNFFKRVLTSGTDKEAFEQLNLRLNQAISQIDLGLGVEQTLIIEQHREDEAADKKMIMDKMGEILELQEKSLQEIQQVRVAQHEQFLELKDYNELMMLNLESLPSDIADKLALADNERQLFLEQQFQKLHTRFERIGSYQRSDKPPIPRHLSIPFHTLTFEEVLRRGSFATVYRAQWQETPVAVKRLGGRLCKEEYQEFIREIKIMAKLRHPNVVQLYGGALEPEAVLVMEYLSEGSLQSVIKREPLDIMIQKQLALDIAKGLCYLHQQQVLHRDLKTANILVDENNHAKLCDFGLSKSHDNKVNTIVKRTTTVEWLAPEVLEGQSIHSEASDIYSFGIVLWSLTTGQEPFSDMSSSSAKQLQLIQRIKSGETPPITDVPQVFRDIIQSCWNKPEERPSMLEIVQQLKKINPEDKPLSPRSLCERGQQYEGRKEFTPAFDCYLESAKGGHMRGQTNVATMYLLGKGTTPNKSQAFGWFKRAAALGHGRAMHNMAMMLERGDGVGKDEEKALHWYREAAKQNNPQAAQCAQALLARNPSLANSPGAK